jgi:hypothetical protein
VPEVSQAPVSMSGGNMDVTKTFVTASRHSKGVYEVQFAYNGPEEKLRDIWQYKDGDSFVELVTGSSFTIRGSTFQETKGPNEYVYSITNLKPVYSENETIKFRVHTKKKNKNLNIYTVARNETQIENIKNSYYKISRTADNFTAVRYHTGSNAEYTKLSYDLSGSYFDFDMSILEPNYQYEICFLRKEASNFIEQEEKFRFRLKKY